MSIYRPNVQTRQALRRQKTALTARLRENMRLKLISLAAAVCLYVFVQSEHNPAISREFSADIIYQQVPSGADVDTMQRHVGFTITGPRSVVESLKDADIHAIANFQGKSVSTTKLQSLAQLTPSIPKLPPDQLNQLNIEQSTTIFKYKLIGFVTRKKAVSILLKSPSAWYRYGKTVIDPQEVTVSGREDYVDMVERVSVSYTVGEDGNIKGIFSVVPRDHDGNVIENVMIAPASVKVSAPLLPVPPAHLVTISANITEYPLPPWTFDSYDVEPRQVKISGNAEAVNRISTLATEKISLRDETDSRDIDADLIIPDGVIVQDMNGSPVKSVKVHVVLHKTSTPPQKPATVPDLPPVDPNG